MDAGTARTEAQLRRGVLEFCVLALLRDRERYGLDLVRQLADAELIGGEGTIYPLLSRLQRDGVVTTTWRESAAGPPRKYYRVSASGGRALDAFIDEWRRFRDTVDTILDKEPADKAASDRAASDKGTSL